MRCRIEASYKLQGMGHGTMSQPNASGTQNVMKDALTHPSATSHRNHLPHRLANARNSTIRKDGWRVKSEVGGGRKRG